MRKEPLQPTAKFGEHDVTRLIVGGNPFRGYSHRNPDLDREMREYHTVENVVQTLGSVKKNVLPFPSTLSAQIWPPWACTMCLAMASPSPVPPPLRARSVL